MRACDYCQLISPPPLTVHHHLIMLARYRLPRDQRAIVAAVTNQAVSAVLEKFVASRSYQALLDPCPGKVASVFAAASPAAEEAVGISFFFLGNRDNFCDRFPEFERCVILINPNLQEHSTTEAFIRNLFGFASAYVFTLTRPLLHVDV